MNRRLPLIAVVALVGVAYLATRDNDTPDPGDLETRLDSAREEVPSVPEPPEPESEAHSAGPLAGPLEGEGSTREEVALAPRVRGRAVDETGAPVAGFRLVGDHRPNAFGSDRVEREFGPFEAGVFELPELEEGRWRLKAVAEGHLPAKRLSFRVPHDGEELAFTLTRQALVRGSVVDPNGLPVEGARVVRGSGGTSEPILTDEEGRFEMEVLPGTRECVARHEDHASSELMVIQTRAGETTEVELQLREGARLVGTVLDREDRGDPEAWVHLRATEWTQDRRKAKTDAQGRFQLEHLAPGTYSVEATHSEAGGSSEKPVRGAVELTDGETTELILGGLNEDAVFLRGTIFNAGQPVPGERIWGSLDGEESFSSGSTTLANDQGRYELEFPGPGPATILIQPSEGQSVPLSIVLGEETDQEFDVHFPTGEIAGVVERRGGSKSKRYTVVCHAEGLSPVHSLYMTRSMRSEKDGSFRFQALPAGSYRLAISGYMGARSVVEAVHLASGATVEGVLLEVGEVGEARVSVVDASGGPVNDAMVFAQDDHGSVYAPGLNDRTGPDGVQLFKKLGLGTFRFFSREGVRVSDLSDPVVIDGSRRAEVTVSLGDGAYARVLVTDGGEPTPARLWVLDEEGNDFSRTLESFDYARYLKKGESKAQYELGPLPPGRYEVRAQTVDGRQAQGVLVLRVEEQETLHLRLGE